VILSGSFISTKRVHSSNEPLFLLAQVLDTHDPDTFVEASGNPNWDTVMNEEYHSLMVNDTWDLVPLPKGRKLVRCKWVYRTKYA
jgi:hypothetical protein